MNDLNKALGDIVSIRRQVAQSTEFRGYGPMTLAATSLFALAAAVIQTVWVPDAAHHLAAYFSLWITTAAASAAVTAVEMYARTRRMHSGIADEMIRMAVEQFLPSVGVGGLLALVVAHFAPGSAWMIPGLWQVIFSLGVFASCRFLPRPVIFVAAWYLLCGLGCLMLAGERAFSPWAMGIPYGVGQLMVAAMLLFHARELAREIPFEPAPEDGDEA